MILTANVIIQYVLLYLVYKTYFVFGFNFEHFYIFFTQLNSEFMELQRGQLNVQEFSHQNQPQFH